MEHYTIATVAERNPDFRRVLWTGKHTQLVVMTIPPGGEIGEEVHEVDQILTFVSGVGTATVSGQTAPQTVGTLALAHFVNRAGVLRHGCARNLWAELFARLGGHLHTS